MYIHIHSKFHVPLVEGTICKCTIIRTPFCPRVKEMYVQCVDVLLFHVSRFLTVDSEGHSQHQLLCYQSVPLYHCVTHWGSLYTGAHRVIHKIYSQLSAPIILYQRN